MVDDKLGEQLRQIRIRHNLSQRQLAKESNVANATISLIENGRLSPTVSMLKKILDGIPVSLAEFFGTETESEGKIFFRSNELNEIARGGVSYRQVGSNLRGKSIQLLKERYEPGAGTGGQLLVHQGEECGLILSGRLTVTVGQKVGTLKAGDAYYFKSDQPHKFSNPGNVPCELITACTPPSF